MDKELLESFKLRDELEERFHSYIKADFTAQTEGLVEEIHRNAAIKVSFAKKRLNKMIEKRQAQMFRTRSGYCERCLPPLEPKSQMVHFCKLCPNHSLCTRP